MAKKFKVEGFKEFDKALKDLSAATAKNIARRVLKKAGQPIAADAARRAPEDWGTLKDSVMVGTRLSKRQKSKARKLPKSAVEVYVGPGALAQATATEFGTADQRPQPFMRPAWDAGKRPALDSITVDMRAEIAKSIARARRKAEREIAKLKAKSKG